MLLLGDADICDDLTWRYWHLVLSIGDADIRGTLTLQALIIMDVLSIGDADI